MKGKTCKDMIWEWKSLASWLRSECDKANLARDNYLMIKGGKKSYLADIEYRRAKDYRFILKKMKNLEKPTKP